MSIVLDVHNYGRYHGNVIGSAEVPVEAFADLWKRLATHFREAKAVAAYGLMNEPHGMKGIWPTAAQAGVDAIRSIDTTHIILVPGDAFSSAHQWRKNNEALAITDPAKRMKYEAHLYFDHDNTGSYKKSYADDKAYPQIGVNRMKPFVAWLKEKGHEGFIGEFGVPGDDPKWLEVIDNFTKHLEEINMPATYWAGGPWWGKSYRMSIEPIDGQDRPQM